MAKVKEGMWVKVLYEDEWFIGKVEKNAGSCCAVRCLTKPFGVHEPQDMEPEDDAVFYEKVYGVEVKPTLKRIGRAWKWDY